MAILAILAVLLFGLLTPQIEDTAQQSSGSGKAAPAKITLTQADGRTAVQVARKAHIPIEVHLSHRWRWSAPRIAGPAHLQRIDFVADPGYDAWLVEPTGKAGTVTIRTTGRPGPRRLTLTIHVR